MIDLRKVSCYIEEVLFPYHTPLQSASESFRESFLRDLEKVANQEALSYELGYRQLLGRSYRSPSVSKTRKNRSF